MKSEWEKHSNVIIPKVPEDFEERMRLASHDHGAESDVVGVFNSYHEAMKKEVFNAYHKGLKTGKKLGGSAGFVCGMVFTLIVLGLLGRAAL